MKIVHIAPSAPYNEYWGYQDNLLPKYHKKLGHEVVLIATNLMHKDGKIAETECVNRELNDGVMLYRLQKKKYPIPTLTSLFSHLEVYDLLVRLKPDCIFHHGLVSTTIFDVVKYKKKINPNCIVIQDNHLDYNIGRKFDSFKDRIVRSVYRYINKRAIAYVDRVYGVTPWRKKYAEDYFQIPHEKTDVLIMGADDEKINFDNHDSIRQNIRGQYNISENDFLIVTGGKIDKKKKINTLMKACIGEDKVKLLIFGNVLDDIKDEFDSLLENNDNIIYIGWIDSDKVYDYFFAADLVFFPGQHSVLWEQACASKVPCVFEEWEGMDHVNNGGNSDFVSPVNTETVKNKIRELKYTEKYNRMKAIAESENTNVYLYSHIASKCLENIPQK